MDYITNLVVHEITSKDIEISGKTSNHLLNGHFSSSRVNFKGNIAVKVSF